MSGELGERGRGERQRVEEGGVRDRGWKGGWGREGERQRVERWVGEGGVRQRVERWVGEGG